MIPLKDDIPVSRPPVVTVTLICVKAAVFLWQVMIGLPLSVEIGGAIPYEVLTFRDVGPHDLVPPPFTVFTSMFLHGGFMHIAGNMLFLWIFGNNVEDALGRLRFLFFYLACGSVAALAQVGVTALGSDPGSLVVPLVGASGAIAGVLAAYMLLFPRARVLTLIPIFIFIRLVYVPAGFFIGLWFVLQLASALIGSSGSGVAFVAHIGGFATGFVLLKLMRLRAGFRQRRYRA
ncbi:MAG TPA: rhomboid family intramembrane serine protease [Anaeromyxobacteraceae bacterium]|nr:rhomboid family intramembrane serine protease [Anaeromyxobacteraceae bacterium]